MSEKSGGGIASLMVKHGIWNSVIAEDGDDSDGCNSPRGAVGDVGETSSDFHNQFGGVAKHDSYRDDDFEEDVPSQLCSRRAQHPPRNRAGSLPQGAAGMDMESLEDELRLIQEERRALLHKTAALTKEAGRDRHGRPRSATSEDSKPSPYTTSARAKSGRAGGTTRKTAENRPRRNSTAGAGHQPDNHPPGTDHRREVSNFLASPPKPQRSPRPSQGEDVQTTASPKTPPRAPQPQGERSESRSGLGTDAREVRRKLLEEVKDAIQEAFQAASTEGGRKIEGRPITTGTSHRPDVEAVAAFATGASRIHTEAIQEDSAARAKSKISRAVALAEARADERVADAVKGGRESREAAAAATAGLQQAKAEIDRLRSERKSLQDRLERWRRDKEEAQASSQILSEQQEEARKSEAKAAKAATKSRLRAEKAEAECASLQKKVAELEADLEQEKALSAARLSEARKGEAAGQRAMALALQEKEQRMLSTEQKRLDEAVAEVMLAQRDLQRFTKVELSALQCGIDDAFKAALESTEEAKAEQTACQEVLTASMSNARQDLQALADEIIREGEQSRAAIHKEIQAFRRPGGKDPRALALELEEIRCELEGTRADLSASQADVEAIRGERDNALTALDAEKVARKAAEQDQTAEAKKVEVLNGELGALKKELEKERSAVVRADQRIHELNELLEAEQHRSGQLQQEEELLTRRLQEQLTKVSEKAVQIARLEGQVDGLTAKLGREMDAALEASEKAAATTIDAMQKLRKKYFDLAASPPRKLQKVPSNAGSAAGFGSSNPRGESSRQPNPATRKGPAAGVMLPGSNDRNARGSGWVVVKLTEKGLDPALRDWAKRAQMSFPPEEQLQAEPVKDPTPDRLPEIQRELLRLEACVIFSLQEALRGTPIAPAAAKASSSAGRPQPAPPRRASADGSASVSTENSSLDAKPSSSRVPRPPSSADEASMLEKRLRGARERVERIRSDAESLALKSGGVLRGSPRRIGMIAGESAAAAGGEHATSRYGGPDGTQAAAAQPIDMAPEPWGGSPGAASEDIGEVMAVLDVLGRESISTAVVGRHQKTGGGSGQATPSPSRTRPTSASSQRRAEYDREFNYGGGAKEPSQPEWQD